MRRRAAQPSYSVIVFLRRSFVAAALVVSLLSALIPLATASSTHLCTMECCAGTAPHLAGACSTGLMKSKPKVTHEPEVLCGLHLHGSANRPVPLEVIEASWDDDDAGPCSGHHNELSDQDASTSAIKPKAPGSASIAAPSMTSPCSPDCGTCSGGYVRQPRPREQAATNWADHARPPTSSPFPQDLVSQPAAHRGQYEQLPPRGPPISLS